MMHRPAAIFKNMSENKKMKSVQYSKSSLPLTLKNEWVGKFLTVYFEKVRSKTNLNNAIQYGLFDKSQLQNTGVITDPTIDYAMFENIRFHDGMPRFLIDLFGFLVGDRHAVTAAFRLLRI